MVCGYCHRIHGFNRSSLMLVSNNSPAVPISYPTGCCIHALVAMIKYPDSHDPRKTRKAENQWSVGPSRFSPYRNRPRNDDSRKNEKTPSIASVCPMMPPALLEKAAQLVPN